MDRNHQLERLRGRTEPWDIVVIGGGATGAGCALDAASRGYSVVLLEQHDFGKGTSSRSTKLIHGGVRYLRQGNISLVREALRERELLLRNASHAVRELEFIIPCYSRFEILFYGLGMKMYDALAGATSVGRSQILRRKDTLQSLPDVGPGELKGGVFYRDAQFDDARLLMDIVRTAETRGAAVLNYAPVAEIHKGSDGQVNGVSFTDLESGEKLAVGAKAVINATGAFCSAIQAMADPAAASVITYSRGVHLVFDRRFMPGDTALLIPKTPDGRVLFCIPWNERLLVGTTDTAVEEAVLEPQASEDEIDFILETARPYLTRKPTRGDVLSVFAGIRPLIKASGAARTSSLSRGHDLFIAPSGLVTITGGKWTTYRKMAEDAVDTAAGIGGLETRKCVTSSLRIEPPMGADDDERLHSDLDITRGAVLRAVRDEMALTVEDVLARRTRALFLDAKIAIELAPTVAVIMAEELDRDAAWVDQSVEDFRTVAAAYLGM